MVDDQFRLNCTRSQHASKRLIADHLLELDDGMREGDSRSGRTDHCRQALAGELAQLLVLGASDEFAWSSATLSAQWRNGLFPAIMDARDPRRVHQRRLDFRDEPITR